MSIFSDIGKAASQVVSDIDLQGMSAAVGQSFEEDAMNELRGQLGEMMGKLGEATGHLVEALDAELTDDLMIRAEAVEPAETGAGAFAEGESVHVAEPAEVELMPHEAVHAVQAHGASDDGFIGASSEAPSAGTDAEAAQPEATDESDAD
jgi:hypothetical protein